MDNLELLKSRIKKVGGRGIAGNCVVYVMSRDQRVSDNHALVAAQKHAIAKQLPFAVVFCLNPHVKGRAREHYDYMLEGLKEVEKKLAALDIPFVLLVGKPLQKITAFAHHTKPDALYFDFNPLRGPLLLADSAAKQAQGNVFIVDAHNIVPVWIASSKREVGAYTMRPKLHKLLESYLIEPEQPVVHPIPWPGTVLTIDSMKDIIQDCMADIPKNGTRLLFSSGEQAAKDHLAFFIKNKLATYAVNRNDPSLDGQSDISPYLHFGQIASLRVALELRYRVQKNNGDLHLLSSPKMPKPEDAASTVQHGADSLIEEMVVRKELADNYCYYCADYNSLLAAPQWALASLNKHRTDSREYVYSYDQLASAATHDSAWNAAQRQMTTTGKMHGYMRMYWAKKVLEWTESPEQAIEFLIKMNDFYSIDGGDPNGYAGILWSIAGVHDRPWFERPVFGVIRYMNYEGLKRKFAIKEYEDTHTI